MAIKYRVAADVVDIRTDQPKAGDTFLVDTNVWFWMSYTKASPAPYQKASYPPYIKLAKQSGAVLHCCALALAELAHVIEKVEREIYESANLHLRPAGCTATSGWLKPKEYRHNLAVERTNVSAEVHAAWGVVQTMANPLDVTIDDSMTAAALGRFQSQMLDGYDLFIVEAITKAGIDQVLTDDGDFCTIPDLCMFTANRNVIKTAASQGKLISR